jgi:hypothetical protein
LKVDLSAHEIYFELVSNDEEKLSDKIDNKINE